MKAGIFSARLFAEAPHQRAPLSIPATNHYLVGSELKSGVAGHVAVRSSAASPVELLAVFGMIPFTNRYRRMKIDQFGKDLAAGSYDLVMLDMLNRKPAYAYGIVREIVEKSKGTTRWHEGTVYHVLHHLEKQGLVTSTWRGPKTGRRRRYYRLTDHGRRAWRTRRDQWQRFVRDLNALLGL